jgi:hypothetical protein
MSGGFQKYLSKEDQLQNAVMTYIKVQHPQVLAIHVPNEGKRSSFERFKFKYLGGLSGVPDILIFNSNQKYHGLAIELKVGYNKPTANQKQFLQDLTDLGWCAVWINSFDKAQDLIDNYLNNEL